MAQPNDNRQRQWRPVDPLRHHRALREQGYPLVVLLNDGFPKEGHPNERYYKPGGIYFEACAKGRLSLHGPQRDGKAAVLAEYILLNS